MVIIKVIRHSDGGCDYLYNMCHYVTDSRAIARGGFGVDPSNPEVVYQQMTAVKKHFNQTSTNPLIHLVISLDGKCDSKAFAVQAAPMIAAYFHKKYQLLWCVHRADETDAHYHIHIMLNSVNLENELLFHSGRYEIYKFAYHVRAITGLPFRVVFNPTEQGS